MKNARLLKGLFVLVISLGIMFLQTNIVFAVTNEDDLFSNTNFENAAMIDNGTDDNEATIGNEIDNVVPNNSSSNNVANDTPTNNTSGNNSSRNNTGKNNTATNREVSNSNQLADTGIGQTGGIIAIIMVVGIISAIYSYKKVDDYKKL